MLSSLSDLDCVPTYYGSFNAWEHRYLVIEYIEGHDLTREWMTRTPVLRAAPWDLHDVAYIEWLSNTVERLDGALRAVHEAGWLLGDIHPKNVIMRDGNAPCFIDFEFAHQSDPDWRCPQGAPGYEPLAGLAGADADRWAMGIMELDLVYPQATIADQGNIWKIQQLLERGRRTLSVPELVCASIRRSTVDMLPPAEQARVSKQVEEVRALSHAALRDEIARGIVTLIDWDRRGPIAPGDIPLYAPGGAEHVGGYPYGAAGIIDALRQSPAGIDHSSADAWLASRAAEIQTRGLRGWEGLAYAASNAGFQETLAALASVPKSEPTNHTLWAGWAGVGLHELATGGDPLNAAHNLESRLEAGERGDSVGLFHGWCAAAIFFAKLFEETSDGRFVRLARRAIEADLERCTMTKNGTLEFDEGWRTLPYLGVGSLGVGLAIHELQRVTGTDEFSTQLSGIDAASTYNQCAQASLAHGLAGFLVYLTRRVRQSPSSLFDEVIASHLESLRLHAVANEDGIFFRGNQSLRLSADYVTGAAGVLAALNEVLEGDSCLPFGI